MRRSIQQLLAGVVLVVCGGAVFGQMMPGGAPEVGPVLPGLEGGGGMALPAGHPSMDGMGGGGAAASQPKVMGALTVQLVAGSAGGKLSADDAVTVELFHRGSPVKKVEAKLDADGKFVVGDLPVMPPVQALVSVKHGGVLQQVVSPELNSEQPVQTLQMKVFETTEERPAWNIAMQHMIVQWSEDGMAAHVTEMISANAPGDRAWLGEKVGEERVTMRIPLPMEAEKLELGGSFGEDEGRIENTGGEKKLVAGGAMFPGRSEYRLSFDIPVTDGKVEIPVTAPAEVGTLIVFMPADETKVSAKSKGRFTLQGGEAVDMGEGSVRMYKATSLAPGESVVFSVSGIKAAQGPDDGEAVKPAGISARNVAMGGAFLIALLGAGMILIKKPSGKKA